uniref:Uncharacterized protein n=1 Tax=Lepeophtheirus salmonis TaxID=72036 RepID=A0A0K2U9U1_LEPSM
MPTPLTTLFGFVSGGSPTVSLIQTRRPSKLLTSSKGAPL